MQLSRQTLELDYSQQKCSVHIHYEENEAVIYCKINYIEGLFVYDHSTCYIEGLSQSPVINSIRHYAQLSSGIATND